MSALVDNQMSIAWLRLQITVMVRVAEMKRKYRPQSGCVDWAAAFFAWHPRSAPRFPSAFAPLIAGTFNSTACGNTGSRLWLRTSVLNALAKDGSSRMFSLSRNLTVMSGQPASFQAGGEYPYPVLSSSGATSNGTVTIAFKPLWRAAELRRHRPERRQDQPAHTA